MAGQSKMRAGRPNLTPEVCGAVVTHCIALCENGRFHHGNIPMASAEFSIHRVTVYRIYGHAMDQLENGYLKLWLAPAGHAKMTVLPYRHGCALYQICGQQQFWRQK